MRTHFIPLWIRVAVGISAGFCLLIITVATLVEKPNGTTALLPPPHDVYETISQAVAKGESVEYIANLSDSYSEHGPSLVLPNWPSSWLDTKKQGSVFRLGNILFLTVIQPDMNHAFYPNNGVDMGPSGNWAGILMSADGGYGLRPSSLAPWFEITNEDSTVPHNIVGIFTAKKTLFVDVSDTHGGGSGEGLVTRLSSQDGGKTWKSIGCFYYLPEAYHTMRGTSDQQIYAGPLRPFALAPTSSCAYKHQ